MYLTTRSRGFTLIEILLVLTILGLLSGMVMLSAPHNQARSLESEARSFQLLLEQTSAAAVRNSEHYGIALGASEWQLLQFDSQQSRRNGWVQISWKAIQSLHPRHRWSVDTQANFSEAIDSRRGGGARVGISQPDLIAYSNGEMSSFVIDISARQDNTLRYRLQSDGLNLKLVTD